MARSGARAAGGRHLRLRDRVALVSRRAQLRCHAAALGRAHALGDRGGGFPPRGARRLLDLWEKAADIRFQETASTADAGILIGADAKTRGRAFTNVTLADSVPAGPQRGGDVGAIRQALICLNPAQPWKIGFDGDLAVYDLRFTMTHEIGHAIGLDHPGPEGQLMSFRYVERSRELQAGDLAGAAALYGRNGAPPNVETRLGAAEKLKDPAKEAGSSLGLSEAPAR